MPLLVLAAALGPAKAVYVLLVGLVLLVPARRFAGLPRGAEPGLKLGAAAAALAGWSVYNLEYVRYILRDVNEIAVFGLAAAVILLLLAARPAWNWWKSRPAHTRRALAAGAVLLLAAAAFAALKALHLGGDLTPEQLAEGMQPNGDSIYTWSVGYTLRHLPALAELLVGTLCAKLPQLLQEMMGACPGEPIVYGAELSWAITIGLLFTTLLAACRPVGAPARLERGTRLVPALVLLGVCGLLVLACLTWTPVNYTILFGLQGRYFLPVLPLALLLWGENRWLCLGAGPDAPPCAGAGGAVRVGCFADHGAVCSKIKSERLLQKSGILSMIKKRQWANPLPLCGKQACPGLGRPAAAKTGPNHFIFEQ